MPKRSPKLLTYNKKMKKKRYNPVEEYRDIKKTKRSMKVRTKKQG